MDAKDTREKLMAALPKVFTRKAASEALGGAIAVGTLANLDSQGKGPAGRIQIGRKIAYEREAFVDWLLERMEGAGEAQ